VKKESEPAMNGHSKNSQDFYRGLVQSEEDSDYEEAKPRNSGSRRALHGDSDTEIEEDEKCDSDATEIAEKSCSEVDQIPKRAIFKRKLKTSALSFGKRKGSTDLRAAKRRKISHSESGSSDHGSEYNSDSPESGSEYSGSATEDIEDDEEEEEEEDEEDDDEPSFERTRGRTQEAQRFARQRPSPGKSSKGREKKTRNGGLQKRNYDESDSDYDYGDCGVKNKTITVSSRGRIRKPKGHAKAGLFH
jgi:hypothetical protein